MLRFKALALAAIATSLAACSSIPSNNVSALEPSFACSAPTAQEGWLGPVDANHLISFNAEHCQPGTFAMTVRSVAHVGSVLYLNSETDYHHPNNLSVAVLPQAQEELMAFFHDNPDRHLEGRQLVVAGTARRVPIYLTSPGVTFLQYGDSGPQYALIVNAPHPTLYHYYQSHVLVESASQIWLKQARAAIDTPTQ
jgi:hypothetical protein